MDLTEEKDIKKRWQEYSIYTVYIYTEYFYIEELYKKRS